MKVSKAVHSRPEPCLQLRQAAVQPIRVRTHPQAAPVAAAATIAPVPGPGGREQRRSVACFRLSFFECDRHGVICESVRNGSWGLVERIPAVRGRAEGASETYYDRYVHQSCLWGRP